MKCDINIEAVVTQTVLLEMSFEEALWLKSVMQNPLYCDDPEDEYYDTKRNRYKLFHSLPSFQELQGE